MGTHLQSLKSNLQRSFSTKNAGNCNNRAWSSYFSSRNSEPLSEQTNWINHAVRKTRLTVQLKETECMEMVKVNICDQTVYHSNDYLKRADLNTDGDLDPIVKEAVAKFLESTKQMEL